MDIRIPSLSPKALGSLCLAVISVILLAGLWPFNFWPANEVTWLKNRNGVHFYGRGIIFAPQPPDVIPHPILRGGPITIELWIQPETEPDAYLPRILSFYDGKETEALIIGQWKSYLILRARKNTKTKEAYREISLMNALPKGQSSFITLTSDETATRIYVNGKPEKTSLDFSFMPTGKVGSHQLILGNSPLGDASWKGYFYGLAIYSRALDAEQVLQNFHDWTNGKTPFFLKTNTQPTKDPSTYLFFPFSERAGTRINDHSSRHNLIMPSSFYAPQKNILVPPWKDFSVSFSYLGDLAVNILGFIPFGFLIFAYLRRPQKIPAPRLFIGVILSAGFLSLAIELIQVYLPGRSSQLMDLLMNISGAALGAAAFSSYLRRRKNRMAFLASILIIALSASVSFAGGRENRPEVKNIIFMVADGMGLGNITAARIFRNGADGPPLYLETLERIGYQRTYSADSTITDSAAAASAWACGEKFNNGEVCFHGDGRPHLPSLLELAKVKGMGTGLITTGVITDATPAAFGAHVISRSCETEIARQYIEVTAPDILLGGGSLRFNPSAPDKCGTRGDFTLTASKRGYAVVFNKTDLFQAVSGGARKILGLFAPGGMTAEHQRLPDCLEPRLPEMAAGALLRLEKEPKGFFLMIEGSQVDAGNHRNNLHYQIGEVLAFDETVKKVLDWANESEERKTQTLIVVTSDHETGGFAIHGPSDRLGRPGEYILSGWTTTEHTGTDVVHWAQGPASARLGKALNNTDIYWILRDLMQAPR